MKKEKLVELIENGLSQREIGKNLETSQSNIRYWLRKYKLKTKPKKYNGRYVNPNIKKREYCSLCGNKIKNNKANRSRCQSCNTRIRRYRTKMKAVELLGGKCKRCGWYGNVAAFEFHHPNNDKKFNIGKISNKSWSVVEKELKKCELLCSNCHRIEHTKFNKDPKFMKNVLNYNGF